MVKNPATEINSKQIQKFLGSLNKVEFVYVEHAIQIVKSINTLIEEFSIPKEVICGSFEIKLCEYDNFTKGNFMYTIKDFAVINSLHYQYSIEKLKENPPVKV